MKELNEKVTAAAIKNNANSTNSLRRNANAKSNNLADEKIKVKKYIIFICVSLSRK